MTAIRVTDVFVTPEAYLAAEEKSQTKHEYLDGVVHAMAGASLEHVRIADNIHFALRSQLSGKPCEAFSSDATLKIVCAGATYFYYPDVTVDCSKPEGHVLEQPTVIFEVLSPSTERNDFGDKLTNYRSVPSVLAYVIIDQAKAAATIYRRDTEGAWSKEFIGDLAGTIALPEIECALPMATVYERVF